MDLKGSREIAADRQTVWAALNDPDVLKASIPGCQELTGSPEEGFEAVVKQKVGPVSATFKGAVTLSNVVPGERYTISGEGKGGAAGFAKGGADVRLEAAGEGATLLLFDVKASVGGKLAQLGSRVIDGFAKKMADQFFESFKREVERPEASAEAGGSAPAPEAASPAPAPAQAPVPDPGAPGSAARSAGPEAPARASGATPGGPATPPRVGSGAAASAAPGLWPRLAGWFRRLLGRG